MKNISIKIIISFLVFIIFATSVFANNMSIISEADLENIESGNEFEVKVKMNLDEDSAAVQGKLEFDKSKFQLVEEEGGVNTAAVELNDYIALVTMDLEGNFILNTINGTQGEQEFKVKFKVKDDVKLNNEKIELKYVDSNLQFENQENVLIVGKGIQYGTYIAIAAIIVGAILVISVFLKNIKKRK